MHFSIPETIDLKDEKQNSSFIAYNIHVNGSFHCTVRYKQLHSFHEQLKKAFGQSSLPFFPPKKLLPLTQPQIEERRSQLEKYIQILSQDQKIVNSEFFNAFLLNAQQESQNARAEEVRVEVYLKSNESLKIQLLSTANTAALLELVAKTLDLSPQFIPYFCLYLVNRDHTNNKNYVLIRKLQNFESPYLSLKTANNGYDTYCIVLRKCYWDSSYDEDLMDDPIAINLLFDQTLDDIERGWVTATKEVQKQLKNLQTKGSKKEFIGLARTLRFYGYLQCEPCFCNYPQPNTRVIIFTGGKELVIRTVDQTKEFPFRVTRIRCWRLTASPSEAVNGSCSTDKNKLTRFELSFEYLLSKDVLKWITINSEQAILISMCLRGMVEELLMKKKGLKLSNDANIDLNNRRSSWSYMKRDGSSHQIAIPRSISTDTFVNGNANQNKGKKFHPKNENSTKNRSLVENDAFDGIGDDDL